MLDDEGGNRGVLEEEREVRRGWAMMLSHFDEVLLGSGMSEDRIEPDDGLALRLSH